MTKINVQVPQAAEYWGEGATDADAQAAAVKLKEMLEEELAEWFPGAEINVEIADPAHGQAADDVKVYDQYGRDGDAQELIKAYIENNWRTALDSVA